MNEKIVNRLPWLPYYNIFRVLREHHNYSKAAVSRGINVSPSTVASHEKGYSEPGLRTIAAYCDFYNLHLHEFFHLLGHIECGKDPRVESDVRKYALQYMLNK